MISIREFSMDWSKTCYNSLEDRNPLKGNTVGSRLNVEKAYIAVCLDGDGSIMLQLKKRSDTSRGYRFMATVCLYQDSRHDKGLHWIRKVLGVGHISKRNDSITELRINGFASVRQVLTLLIPYIRFKTIQADALLRACLILESKKMINLCAVELRELVDLIFVIEKQNYKRSQALTK